MIEKGKFYTGIGSRETPTDIMEVMTHVAARLEEAGMILRSGGADGADTAFEQGVSATEGMEMYLPWRGFNYRCEEGYHYEYTDRHVEIASKTHPSWAFLKRGARSLHTRNVAQVLGLDCETFSSFVICWTRDGAIKGGTATAMRIAISRGIPVFNMHFDSVRSVVEEYAATGEYRESEWSII